MTAHSRKEPSLAANCHRYLLQAASATSASSRDGVGAALLIKTTRCNRCSNSSEPERSRSHLWCRRASSDATIQHRSDRPSRRHRRARSRCFMLVLSIDSGKVSEDLITEVTHKLSSAWSSYRLGEIRPCPAEVMARVGFVRQLWSLWVKRFQAFSPAMH